MPQRSPARVPPDGDLGHRFESTFAVSKGVRMSDSLEQLRELGVSIWLDDLSRMRLDSGSLETLVRERCVRGVTTNPSIFEKAISTGAAAYADDLRSFAAEGCDVDEIIQRLTTDDVRRACDLLMPVWRESRGADGRVSIEVDPRLAHDTAGTVTQGKALWQLVNRPNAMIKVPATEAGLQAITELIGAGVCVNVTLIFSLERYRDVVRAYKAGLTLALTRGLDLGPIRSVASVFVSRIDSAVDPMLEAIGSEKALSLLGAAAIANSRLVWEAFLESRRTASWSEMQDMGAHKQRPLWASTGVKDPRFNDTRYVMDLAVPDSVNTVPEQTLQAVHDHGEFVGDAVTDSIADAHLVWESLESLGISRQAVCDKLEADGVRLFIEAWERLRETVALAAETATVGH